MLINPTYGDESLKFLFWLEVVFNMFNCTISQLVIPFTLFDNTTLQNCSMVGNLDLSVENAKLQPMVHFLDAEKDFVDC